MSRLEIFNNTGERVFIDYGPANTGSKSANLSNYPKGIYIIKVFDGTQACVKKLVVK